MKKTVTLSKRNYMKFIYEPEQRENIDFETGSTCFKFENKNGFVWSFRFFKVKEGLYQTAQRLGHMKETFGFCGSLETIMEHIINC